MKVVRGYKTALDPNNTQRTLLLKHAGALRFAYNWGLARKIAAYKSGAKVPSAIDLHRELNTLKQTDYRWMYEVSKCASQEALRNLDKAYANFFQKVKRKKQGTYKGKLGFPTFKQRSKAIGSFRLTGSIKIFSRTVQLPRIGKVRLHEHDYIPTDAKILSATVSEHAGHWYVSVQVAAHKLTSYLCKNHALVAIEDLHVAGMLKNHCLAQAVSDSNFGEIRRQLEYKAHRNQPSFRLCPKCLSIGERRLF